MSASTALAARWRRILVDVQRAITNWEQWVDYWAINCAPSNAYPEAATHGPEDSPAGALT